VDVHSGEATSKGLLLELVGHPLPNASALVGLCYSYLSHLNGVLVMYREDH
jgi:hypothetical protein